MITHDDLGFRIIFIELFLIVALYRKCSMFLSK